MADFVNAYGKVCQERQERKWEVSLPAGWPLLFQPGTVKFRRMVKKAGCPEAGLPKCPPDKLDANAAGEIRLVSPISTSVFLASRGGIRRPHAALGTR